MMPDQRVDIDVVLGLGSPLHHRGLCSRNIQQSSNSNARLPTHERRSKSPEPRQSEEREAYRAATIDDAR